MLVKHTGVCVSKKIRGGGGIKVQGSYSVYCMGVVVLVVLCMYMYLELHHLHTPGRHPLPGQVDCRGTRLGCLLSLSPVQLATD